MIIQGPILPTYYQQGLTWTNQTLANTATDVMSISWGANTLVAVGGNSTNQNLASIQIQNSVSLGTLNGPLQWINRTTANTNPMYNVGYGNGCLLYTSPSPRDRQKS